MTQEEKQLLIKDLCARLPFGVILDNPNPCGEHWDELISIDIPQGTVTLLYDGRIYKVEKIKPYLRPMLSMTDKERDEKLGIVTTVYDGEVVDDEFVNVVQYIDWLNEHHFDFRNLIERGLAIDCTNLNIY